MKLIAQHVAGGAQLAAKAKALAQQARLSVGAAILELREEDRNQREPIDPRRELRDAARGLPADAPARASRLDELGRVLEAAGLAEEEVALGADAPVEVWLSLSMAMATTVMTSRTTPMRYWPETNSQISAGISTMPGPTCMTQKMNMTAVSRVAKTKERGNGVRRSQSSKRGRRWAQAAEMRV